MEYFQFPDLRTIHADNCGCAKLSPGWIHPRRRLGSSVLIIGVKGQVSIVDTDAHSKIEHDIGPGTVVILPAGRVHYGSAQITAPATYFWFHFSLGHSPGVISEAEYNTILSDTQITSHRLENGALLPLNFDLPDPEPFWQVFHDLLFEQENPSYTQLKFQLMFQSLLICLTEAIISLHNPKKASLGTSSVAYSVVTWMCEHLTDPNLSIKTIAAAIGLNQDYVGRRFREIMGLSVGDYLLRKRIELATKRLQETNASIQAIAEGCGFSSVRHFFRQFKFVRGMTPAELRKRYKVMHVNSL